MALRPRSLLVHVGHGKTGSSYVQSALAGSRDTLRDHGIAYPIAEDRARAAQDGGISSGNLRYTAGALRALLNTPQAQEAEQVLISSESLFPTLTRGGEGFLAEAQAAVPGIEVKVLLYIRDPMDHAVSCYHQDVKRGGFTGSFAQSLADYNIPQKVGSFLRLFTDAGVDVAVRNYARHSKAILPSFENWLGLPGGSLALPPVERVNRSLTLGEIELQKAFNVHFGKEARRFVSDPLCTHLPEIRSELPPLAESDLVTFLDRMRGVIGHEVFAQAIPAEEAYALGTFADHAARFAAVADSDQVTFSRAQLTVFVDALHKELARVTVLRKMLHKQRDPERPAGRAKERL